MTTKMAHVPYALGEKFLALDLDPQYGTCLRTFTVTHVWLASNRDASGRALWDVRGEAANGRVRVAQVRSDGTDRHGYVERVAS